MEIDLPSHRMQETLLAYNVDPLHVPLVLKYFEYLVENSNDKELTVVDVFADFFEVSSDWLRGDSLEITTAMDKKHSLQQFILELIHCKRYGFKPKIIFVQSIADNTQHREPAFLVFIELLKITKTGMAFTVFKPWSCQHIELILLLCQKVGLYFKGLYISAEHYQTLLENALMPYVVLKDPIGLFHPESELKVEEDHPLESYSFIEELAYGAIEPTRLT